MTNNIIFIANWKMYGNKNNINGIDKVVNFLKKNKKKKFKVIYCPPYTLLSKLKKKFSKTRVLLGAQNCHHEINYGPYTGSINAKLLKNEEVKYIIIGHSENRSSGDTDYIINQKIKSAIRENLNVIFCVGETLEERKKKITSKVIKKQILNGLRNIEAYNKIIISYEPRWSIGTGKILHKEDLEKVISLIIKILSSLKKNAKFKIIYGGSVNKSNIHILRKIQGVDGFLIGGASLKAQYFY